MRKNSVKIPGKLLGRASLAIALLAAGVVLALFASGLLFGLAGVAIGLGFALGLDALVRWGER